MSDHHHQRNPEEIESDIKQHREQLDNTLGEMEDRFSPQQLLNSAYDYVRHGGANEFASNLSETIRHNPVPFLVTTVGLGWLFWSQRNGGQRSQSPSTVERHSDRYPMAAGEAVAADDLTAGVPGTVPERAGTPGEATKKTDPAGMYGSDQPHSQGRTGAVKEKAHHMSNDIKSRSHDMSRGMHDYASRLGQGSRNAMHGASDHAQNAGQQTAQFIKEHPVMAGAIGIALGAALGGILPSTRAEDERMGGLRDKTVDRAAEEGERYAEEARHKVHEKAEQHERQGASHSSMGAHGTSGGSQDAPATQGASGSSASRTDDASAAEESDKARTTVSPTATTPGSADEATDSYNRPTSTGRTYRGTGGHEEDPRSDNPDR